MEADHVGPKGLHRLLDAVVKVNADLELEAVLSRVLDAAVGLVGCRYGALGVLDDSRTRLAQFVTVGVDDETREAIGDLPTGLGLLRLLIDDARPVRLDDISQHPASVGFPPNHPPMRSFLGVPIAVRGQVFGNLYLTEKNGGEPFGEVDEELALALASAAGVAIDNARLFDQVRRRQGALDAMNDIAAALLSGAGRQESLRLVVSRARELLDADLATLAVPVDGDMLSIEIADGTLIEGMKGFSFAREGSVSGEVMATGRQIVLRDAAKDDRFAQPQVGSGVIGPAVWTLLSSGSDDFGTLAVCRRRGAPPFRDREVELISSFAAQASVILEHDRDRERAERLALVEDQERIARELHDMVIQRLFAMGLSLQGSVRLSPEGVIRHRLQEAIDEIDSTIRQIRTVIFELEDASHDQPLGIRGRVLALAAESSRMLGFTPTVSFTGPLDTLVDAALGDEMLAALREALTNVAKHASADHATVEVVCNDAMLEMTVTDDGVGPAARRGGGRGVHNMSERARRLGGEFSLGPGEEGGTVVYWAASLRY